MYQSGCSTRLVRSSISSSGPKSLCTCRAAVIRLQLPELARSRQLHQASHWAHLLVLSPQQVLLRQTRGPGRQRCRSQWCCDATNMHRRQGSLDGLSSLCVSTGNFPPKRWLLCWLNLYKPQDSPRLVMQVSALCCSHCLHSRALHVHRQNKYKPLAQRLVCCIYCYIWLLMCRTLGWLTLGLNLGLYLGMMCLLCTNKDPPAGVIETQRG